MKNTIATLLEGPHLVIRTLRSALLPVLLLLGFTPAWAVDFHVTTAQELQNALTVAAVNGADDTVYLAKGYYVGNFNFNSAEAASLTLQGEPGATNTDITFDGAGGGRDLNLACTANVAITVRGITFSRNCAGNAALRVSAGSGIGADVVVEDCRFISPPGTTGAGLEIASSKSATINRCSTIGVSGSGNGMTITTGNATVQNCTFATNNSMGLSISVSSDVTVQDCQFIFQDAGLALSSGINATLSRCAVNGTGGGRGISVNGFSGNVEIQNCILANNGGGIDIAGGATITVTNSRFEGNMALQRWITTWSGTWSYHGSGGGALLSGSRILLANNAFTSNSVQSGHYPPSVFGIREGGAAVDCSGSIVILTNNTFAGNTYNYAACLEGAATVIGNSFVNNPGCGSIQCLSGGSVSGNMLTGNGGPGISGSGTVVGNTIRNNAGFGISGSGTISGNTIVSNAGVGISVSGTSIVSNNTIKGNNGGGLVASGTPIISGNFLLQNHTTDTNGAGIQASGDTLKLYNNVVAGNVAPNGYKGGGLYLNPSVRLELVNNTVTGNSAGDGGGVAISISGVTERLYAYNNILWGNTASGNGADVWLVGTGQRKEFFNNDAHGMYGVWDLAQNGLDVAPLFYDPVNGDYHLRVGSPCIDTGTNAVALLPTLDLDGNPRMGNTLVDIGAYEFFNTSAHPADTNINWQMESPEFNAYATAWKADQLWESNSIPADYLTRAGYLKAKGGAYTNDGSTLPLNWKPR